MPTLDGPAVPGPQVRVLLDVLVVDELVVPFPEEAGAGVAPLELLTQFEPDGDAVDGAGDELDGSGDELDDAGIVTLLVVAFGETGKRSPATFRIAARSDGSTRVTVVTVEPAGAWPLTGPTAGAGARDASAPGTDTETIAGVIGTRGCAGAAETGARTAA